LTLSNTAQRGVSFSIFEKEKQLNYRSNEWTMAIHWSLDRLETLLPPHLFAKLAEISCNPAIPIDAGGKYPIIHGETGNLLAGVPYAKGLRVPRSRMRALCAEGIDVQVRFSITSQLTQLMLFFRSMARKLSTLLSTRAARV
jgi:hypothetical protein